MATIDVVIPCFNDSKYLGQAIASVMTQGHTDWRMWLIDDGSTDDTTKVMASWVAVDGRITAFKFDQNAGAGVARNAGAGYGSGEYLIFLDADDRIDVSYIHKTLGWIGDHAYCYTDSMRYFDRDKRIERHDLPGYSPEWFQGALGEDRTPLITSLMCRDAFEAVGGFDPAFGAGEDYVLYVKLAAAGYSGVRLPEPLFWHRFQKDGQHRWGALKGQFPKTEQAMRRQYPQVFADREIKLNLACGDKLLDGYTNHDLTIDGVDMRRLPYHDGRVAEIQCHHAIEHVGRDEVGPLLREWARVLKRGGRLVVSCPDIDRCMRLFLALSVDERWVANQMNESIWGSQCGPQMRHYTGFDEGRLRKELEAAGFSVEKLERLGNDHGAPGLRAEAAKR